jgi:hypothetical protein
MPERQHPLIEPDVRFSRIRFSDHLHRQADAGVFHGAASHPVTPFNSDSGCSTDVDVVDGALVRCSSNADVGELF